MNCPVIATRVNDGERHRTGFEPMACKGSGVRIPVPPRSVLEPEQWTAFMRVQSAFGLVVTLQIHPASGS